MVHKSEISDIHEITVMESVNASLLINISHARKNKVQNELKNKETTKMSQKLRQMLIFL